MHKLFTPPVFNDENKTHQAFLLHVILWALIVVPVPYVLYSVIQTPEHASRALTQAIVGEAVNLFLLVLLRRGYVRLASILQVMAFWGFFTSSAITGAGVHGQAYLLGYGLVIVIAGILLGGWGAMAMTLLAILSGGLMVYVEATGLRSFNNPDASPTVWVVSAVLFPVMAVLQNLAARTMRTALTRARASEERLRKIVEHAEEIIYTLSPDGTFTFVSPAWSRLLGQPVSAVVGRAFASFVHPEDIPAYTAFLGQVLATGQPQSRIEYRVRHRDGEWRWHSSVGAPVKDGQNQSLYYVGIAQDITARKQAETEREQLITELAAKNAELERFTYTVSHDLKSPLVTINGFLSWLERDIQADKIDRVKADINRIREAADKMHLLLEELLELSRIGRLMNPPESVPFETIVREALALVEGQLARRGVVVEVAEKLPVVYGDRARLVEVVQNLVDNAAKFMGDQMEPRIEIGVREQGGQPLFFVQDNGIGIEPQYQQKVFGLFEKLNVTDEGTGIGLALVKRIVEVHGGRIWVESAGAETGTTFYFTLPVAGGREE